MKKKSIIFLLILGIIAGYLILRGYPEKVTLEINGEEVVLKQSDKENEINLTTLNSIHDIKVNVKAYGKLMLSINNYKISKYKENNLGKIVIGDNKKLNVSVKFKNGKTKKYTINTLPSSFPEYETTNNGDTFNGNYYMTTYSPDEASSYIFALNTDGNVIYYKQVPGFCSQFRKETSKDGDIRYVYTAQDKSSGSELNMEDLHGKFIIMNEEFEIIDEATYISSDKNDNTYTIFEYLDDGHYFITSSNKQKVNNVPGYEEVTLTQNNLQEVKNGKVVFEWRSEDYPELYQHVSELQKLNLEESNDYLHFNMIKVDPKDNNILVSFRNISAIIKINRKTGEIMWTLGGKKDDFKMSKKQKFAYQHSIYFNEDGSMTIFDNGDNRVNLGIKNESKVVTLKLNEELKKVESYKSYRLKEVYSMAMGSVQTMDLEHEIYLISYGSGMFANGPVALIDFANNKTLFSFDLKNNKIMFSTEKE